MLRVFLQTPIRSRSPLLTGSRLISLPLATQMFQFAKFEKSKERSADSPRSLDTVSRSEIHGSQTVSPHGLSPLKASFLLNARASIQCIIFDTVRYAEHQSRRFCMVQLWFLNNQRKKTSDLTSLVTTERRSQERKEGLEPSTSALARLCSTIPLSYFRQRGNIKHY